MRYLLWLTLMVTLGQPRAIAQDTGATKAQGLISVAEAVHIALEENPMIAASRAEAKAAGAEARSVRAMTLPQLSANTFLTAGNSSNIVSGSPGVLPQSLLNVPKRPFADQNLTFMIPIYTGGKLSGEARAAEYRRKSAEAQTGSTQAEVALQVKQTYYRVLVAQEFEKVASARVNAASELVRNSQVLYDAGKGIEASLLRAQAEKADAERELTMVRNDAAKALLDLKTAMGVEASTDITLSDKLTFIAPSGDVASSLKETANQRPELLAAKAKTAAARAMAGSARGALQPQIYGLAMADAFDSREMGSGSGGTVGLSISFPLFDAGQRRAESEKAQAMVEVAVAEARSTAFKVENEVREAWLDIGTAARNLSTSQAALIAAQSAYDVIALRVQNQKSIMVEQLDSLAALTRAKANVAQALYDHSVAKAKLQRAIGLP
jgi:outer membrane protein